MITFEEFDKIINFLKDFENNCMKIEKLTNKLNDNDFPPFNLFGLTMEHFNIIIKLLNNIFNLKSIGYVGTDLEYWIFEKKYGTDKTYFCKYDDKEIFLRTNKQLYDYLLKDSIYNE